MSDSPCYGSGSDGGIGKWAVCHVCKKVVKVYRGKIDPH